MLGVSQVTTQLFKKSKLILLTHHTYPCIYPYPILHHMGIYSQPWPTLGVWIWAGISDRQIPIHTPWYSYPQPTMDMQYPCSCLFVSTSLRVSKTLDSKHKSIDLHNMWLPGMSVAQNQWKRLKHTWNVYYTFTMSSVSSSIRAMYWSG